MVGTVMYTFTEWYKTPWDKIDVDYLAEETKKLQKDVKQLNKAVRNYEVRMPLPHSCATVVSS
jgi:dynein heavy chain, axonemal